MTWYLEDQEPTTGLPPLTAPIPTPGESFSTGFFLDRLTRNTWNVDQKYMTAVEDEMRAKLGIPEPDPMPGDPNLGVSKMRRAPLYKAALEARERDPAGFGGLPLDEDGFTRAWQAKAQAELADAQALLANTPDGRWGLETAGLLASNIVDPVTIATAPLGAPARLGIAGTMAIEGAVNALGEAMTLPSQFDQAEALDIEGPNVAAQLAIAGVTGAGLAGLLKGAGRYIEYRRTRAGADGERFSDDAATVEQELAVLAARRELEAGRAAGAAATPGMDAFDFSAAGNASAETNRVGYVFGRLLERGYEPHVAAGLAGNLMQESSPGLFTKAVGDGGNAYGIGQWNGPRMRALQAFAAKRGASADDLDTQIAFLDHELKGPEASAAAAIKGARSAEEAALIASREFWRPGVPHNANRVAYARAVFDQFKGGSVPKWEGRLPAEPAGGWVPTTRGYTGAGQVVTGAGRRLDVEYQVVDLGALRQATGDLQPRDRGRANSDAWVSETAARLDPALLLPAPTADRGAPLVGPDDVIESGNGRVRAIGRAYDMHPDRAAAYRDQLEAAGYAIPEGVERPVLVARRTTELDDAGRRELVVEAQDSGVAELTPSERARAVARQLTPERLDLADPEARIGAASNAGFVRAITEDLPAGVRNRLYAGGALTAEGRRELRQAVFARAWPDRDILERALEADESGELAGLLAGLERAAPAWAALRADIEAGLVRPEFDIVPEVLDAIRMIETARELGSRTDLSAGAILGELLDQVDLIDGPISPLTAALVRRFWRDGRAVKADEAAAFLRSYAAEARKAGRSGDLLAGASVADVLRSVDREAFADLPDEFVRVPAKRFGGEAPVVVPELPEGAFAAGARSPEAEAGDALAAEDLRADGPFGPVFVGYTDDPDGAIARLMQEKAGEVADAVVHPELGPVALVYGTPKYGLLHIQKKHPEMLADLPRLLREGRLEVTPGAGEKHAFLVDDRTPVTVAALRLDWDDKQKVWLATAYVDHRGKHARQVQTSDEPPASASSRVPDATGQVEDSASVAADQGDAIRAALDDFRAEGEDFRNLPIAGGTVGGLLDEIDEDMALAEVIASCGLGGAVA